MNRQNNPNKSFSIHLSTVRIACTATCLISLLPTQFASSQISAPASGGGSPDFSKVSSWPILTNETIVLLKGTLQDRNRDVKMLRAEVARLKMLLKASMSASNSAGATFSKSMRAQLEQNLSQVRTEFNAVQRELTAVKSELGKKNETSDNLKFRLDEANNQLASIKAQMDKPSEKTKPWNNNRPGHGSVPAPALGTSANGTDVPFFNGNSEARMNNYYLRKMRQQILEASVDHSALQTGGSVSFTIAADGRPVITDESDVAPSSNEHAPSNGDKKLAMLVKKAGPFHRLLGPSSSASIKLDMAVPNDEELSPRDLTVSVSPAGS